MNIIFRVDASILMGIGHLMRCLTLAELLSERGAQVSFICREHKGHLLGLLRQKAMQVSVLPLPDETDLVVHSEDYTEWLGVSQSEDANNTIAALADVKPDWLIVDHYGLDIEWEKRLRPRVGKLLVLDDLANRRHDCDMLLDQNYSLPGESRYKDLVADNCRLLIGPRYALLRPEFAAFRNTIGTRDNRVENILVFFGGTDPDNMTGHTLEALSTSRLGNLHVDVVIGVNNPHRKEIEKQVLERPFTILHNLRPHLADLMAKADLAIGAGGTTTWERMCLGLPSIVIAVAENQRSGAELLAEKELVNYLGEVSEVNSRHIKEQIIKLIEDPKKLVDQSERNQLLVDGLGARRVGEAIYPTDISSIQLRNADLNDMKIYYEWANDIEVRNNSFNKNPISWKDHKKWFPGKIDSPTSYLFVLDADGLPVGQVRFDKEGTSFKIDYSLDEMVRGRGWGKNLIWLGMQMLEKLKPVRFLAEVHTNNLASRSVFVHFGFEVTRRNSEYLVFQLDWE